MDGREQSAGVEPAKRPVLSHLASRTLAFLREKEACRFPRIVLKKPRAPPGVFLLSYSWRLIMTTTNKQLHLAYAADEKYARYVEVAIRAAYAKASRPTDLIVHFLDCGLLDNTWGGTISHKGRCSGGDPDSSCHRHGPFRGFLDLVGKSGHLCATFSAISFAGRGVVPLF